MTQTLSTDMIDPEVWADMMQAEFTGRAILGQDGQFATVDDTLEGVPGSTIGFPKWLAMGDMADADEAVALVPEKLDTDPGSEVTIKEAGKAAEVTDRALLVGYGDPLAEVKRQFGRLTVRKIDGDLRTEAEKSTLALDGSAGTFGAFVVAQALGEFGDEADPQDMAGFVIHSKQRTAAFQDENFISADKYGAGQVIVRGEIGNVYGVRVVVSDRTSVVDDGAGNLTYKGLLIKRGALGLLYKRRPQVEQDRDILARSTVVTTNIHYAAALLKADDGVCVVTTK